MTDTSRIDRRQFTRLLAVAASGPVALAAANSPAADEKPAVTPADPKPLPKDQEPEAAPPEELLLLSVLLRRYPSEQYNDNAMRGIFRDLRGDLARGRALREFPLTNSDEPHFVFRALRGHE